MILWLDNDVLVRRFEIDIAPDFDSRDMQAMVMEHSSAGVGLNTGVWIMRNSVEMRAFLQDVWDTGPQTSTGALNDQGTVTQLLGFSCWPNQIRPWTESSYQQNTGWLDRQYNGILSHDLAAASARFVHTAGAPLEVKLWLLKTIAKKDQLPGAEALFDYPIRMTERFEHPGSLPDS